MIVLRRILPYRTAREWAGRGLFAAVFLAWGYAGAVQSLAYTLSTENIEIAHMLAPGDGRLTAAFAQNLVSVNASRVEAGNLARTALEQDPTAVAAVSTLGAIAQTRGDVAAARRLFSYAEVLSRRNLETQLWAIEDAVSRNDIKRALRHYDIALRTYPSSGDLLFPVLASAAEDPTIRAALVTMLVDRPAWGERFINSVAAGATDMRPAASLFLALEKAGVPVPDGAKAAVISGLIKAGAAEEAWTYYATMRPGVSRNSSRDLRLADKIITPSAFDWTPIATAGGITSIQAGVVDFSAGASIGGSLLQQMQMLPPGVYRIEGHSIGIDQPAGAHPYWVLTCWGDREIGRVDMTNSTYNGGKFSGSFSVPANCPVQMLTLVARASDTMLGLSGQIDRLQLTPVP